MFTNLLVEQYVQNMSSSISCHIYESQKTQMSLGNKCLGGLQLPLPTCQQLWATS